MRTPQTATLVIPAGDHGVILPYAGKWLEIIACTGPDLLVGFDADPPQVMFPGRGYPSPKNGFQSVRVVDNTGAGCTATVTVSDEPLAGQEAGVLVGMAADIAAIEQELSGAALSVQIAAVNVPITGGAGLQIFAANPARSLISLTTPETNGGFVYLGNAAGNVSQVDFMDLLYPGSNWYDERYKGAIFAVGNDALEWIGGYEV